MADLEHLAGSHEAKQKAAIDGLSGNGHTHSVSDVTGLQSMLDLKHTLMVSQPKVANAPTNAPNNAPTNLNPLSTLLGALVGEVNATNAKQNQTANNVNEVAQKLNDVIACLKNLGLMQNV